LIRDLSNDDVGLLSRAQKMVTEFAVEVHLALCPSKMIDLAIAVAMEQLWMAISWRKTCQR
jgi:hypothetical protein